MESDGVNLAVGGVNGEDGGEGIVRGVHLNHNLGVRHPMGEEWCMCEFLLEFVEGCAAFAIEVPRGILSRQTSEGSGDFRVAIDEPAVEVGKAKEGLNVFDFPRFQPIEDGLHFVFGHAESVRGENVSEVFHTVPVEFAFPGIGI
jgi:hypothetical protein